LDLGHQVFRACRPHGFQRIIKVIQTLLVVTAAYR
jgi:hypothetical protein